MNVERTTRFLNFPVLDFASVRQLIAEGLSPEDLVREIFRRIAARGEDSVWIYLPKIEEVLAGLSEDRTLPLFGVPFAIKDNIDVKGWPTTAACPEFAYIAQKDSNAVRRLREAGAIPIGKTNLDQFATGLVGTRSPYGVPSCIYDDRYISGGSSSGSAVAVAAGLVSFALGTDTAGSGRVPAALNGIVGLKPTRGIIGASGVVPACRSLDCVSIFANTVADSAEVLTHTRGADHDDIYSRTVRRAPNEVPRDSLRIGVPFRTQLEFFGDAEARQLFDEATAMLASQGHSLVEIDFSPFRQAAQLLYSGPWVAERMAGIESFFKEHGDSLHPVTRKIIGGGSAISGVETFEGLYELERLRILAAAEWKRMDVLLLPTTGTIYSIEQVIEDPIQLNTNLGYYTNFVNLLDLCGIAVPAGIRPGNELPFGVTLLAQAFQDELVCGLAARFLAEPEVASAAEAAVRIEIAVVGAHLSGQPLNWQLTGRGAVLTRNCRTASHYRLYALANTSPPKPGLVRAPGFKGKGIEVEVWSMTPEAFGDFVANVPQPMVIGTIDLEDGTQCKGFLCEPCVCEMATEITHLGGWRNYVKPKG